MRVDLNPDEVQELHDALALICGREPGERPHLETAMKKLRRVGRGRLCRHCGERMSRRKNRLCDACNAYGSRFGKLPPGEVLERRAC